MKRISRDTWLAISLVVILIIITVASAVRTARGEAIPAYASFSTRPDGVQALRLWLDALGYTTSNDSSEVFQLPENASLVWIMEPSTSISEEEWKVIDDWVEKGGTLILAGESLRSMLALEHYQAQVLFLAQPLEALTLQVPLFNSPPITGMISVNAHALLETTRQDYATLLAGEEKPVLVSIKQGEGRVFLSTTPFPFSNAGLKQAGNPELVLNLVATARPGSVWFDEWHHGIRTSQREIIGPDQWLRYTPAGHALLYVAGVIFLALVLQGRSFGHPVPLSRDVTRRAPLDYATALANLNRRAGHRAAVLRHLSQQIKRNLGRRYRIDPSLPDEEYIAELAHMRPDLDTVELLSLLKRLRQLTVSEREMVQLARQASGWINE